MSQIQCRESLDLSDLIALYSPEMTFGDFMRSLREAQNISLRTLAKEVKKTPTYISDIEHGNNRPPDKKLLDAILNALRINEYQIIREKLYDLAAIGRDDLPADVKAFVTQTPDLIAILRSINSNPKKDTILAEITIKYCRGGEQ